MRPPPASRGLVQGSLLDIDKVEMQILSSSFARSLEDSLIFDIAQEDSIFSSGLAGWGGHPLRSSWPGISWRVTATVCTRPWTAWSPATPARQTRDPRKGPPVQLNGAISQDKRPRYQIVDKISIKVLDKKSQIRKKFKYGCLNK